MLTKWLNLSPPRLNTFPIMLYCLLTCFPFSVWQALSIQTHERWRDFSLKCLTPLKVDFYGLAWHICLWINLEPLYGFETITTQWGLDDSNQEEDGGFGRRENLFISSKWFQSNRNNRSGERCGLPFARSFENLRFTQKPFLVSGSRSSKTGRVLH